MVSAETFIGLKINVRLNDDTRLKYIKNTIYILDVDYYKRLNFHDFVKKKFI